MSVVVQRTNKIMRHLRQAGATNEQSAIPVGSIPYSDRWYFEKLVRFGAVVRSGDLCYLDESRAHEYQKHRFGKALVFLFICFLAFFIIWLFGGFR